MYADIILPLALERNYTFGVPVEFQDTVKVGCRVEVQFGAKRVYSGLVKRLHQNKPESYTVKPIRTLLDPQPLVTEQQLEFWEWLASYYGCTEGEVMNAALPSFLKLESETFVRLNEEVVIDEQEVTDDEFIILQALEIHQEKIQQSNAKKSSP
jgi:primosomal protein N' (replication factor Y)